MVQKRDFELIISILSPSSKKACLFNHLGRGWLVVYGGFFLSLCLWFDPSFIIFIENGKQFNSNRKSYISIESHFYTEFKAATITI